MGYKINGNSAISTGDPADAVFVWNYATGALVAKRTPDALGDWEVLGLLSSTEYGVTTTGPSGYQPYSHGPVIPVPDGRTEATLNPSDKGTNCTLSALDTTATFSAAGSVRSTLSKSAGKWYWEVLVTVAVDSVIGVASASADINQYTGQNPDSWGYYRLGGVLNNSSFSGTQSGYAVGDIIGVALDADAKTVQFYKNGVATGGAVTGLPTTIFAAVGAGEGGGAHVVNFGATMFAHSVPAGYNRGLYV